MSHYKELLPKITVRSFDQTREFPSLDWARQYALKELVPQEINFVVSDQQTGEIFMDVRFGARTTTMIP
ncbi:hypothetical protein [Paenibacillus campi]|uniref:hypothetical protein n=1 Tax=Paenibacillus campi TaxID=3106031 RepID=UPI002AFE605E|nr:MULTISPECIES: hypothetical protein [unclassified Paenibacillus]